MSSKDPSNLKADNPEDYLFVSAKHYARKTNIDNGHGNDIDKFIGRPGPITGLMLSIVDMATTLFIRFSLLLLQISTIAFDWVYNMTFGNFSFFMPKEAKKGIVISMKWFRYLMTVIMPPFGIFLHKGMYGWFSIGICMLITYINYIAGIVYAFVICIRNRYADQYEDLEMRRAMAYNKEETDGSLSDMSAFWSMLVFLGSIFITLFLLIRYS